jgi:cytidine deaminase
LSAKRSIEFSYDVFEGIGGLPQAEAELLKAANKILLKAYAPYSRFKVGAAIALTDGRIFTGNNQENVAYPSGLCAERVALFHVMSQNPEAEIEAIAIAAHPQDFELSQVISPCGACRQALLEYETRMRRPIKVILGSEHGEIYRIPSVASLLPLSFRESKLKKED